MKICNYVLFITSFFISELLFAKTNEYACYGGWRNKVHYVSVSTDEISSGDTRINVPAQPPQDSLHCRGWQKHSESGSKACSDPRIKAYFENKLKTIIKNQLNGPIEMGYDINESYINDAVKKAEVWSGYDSNFEGLGDKAFERKDDGSGELQQKIHDVCY